jgi:hypothetical protein
VATARDEETGKAESLAAEIAAMRRFAEKCHDIEKLSSGIIETDTAC